MTIAIPTYLLAICVAAGPQQSQPEALGVIAVAPAPGPGPELVDATEKLHDELAKRRAGVVDARELRDRMTGQPSTASLPELDRAYAAAVEAGKRDPARAISWLGDVITELERQPGGPETYAQWTRAKLRLARLRLEYATSPEEGANGIAEARTLAEQAIRLAPDAKLDPAAHPKRLLALVDEVRAELKKAPPRKLVVKSSLPNTRIFVDGKEIGVAPAAVTLRRGSYRVTGAQGELRAPMVLANVRDEDETVTLDFSLATIYRPALGPGIVVAGDVDAKVVQVASTLGLDRVVTVSLLEQKQVRYLEASVVVVKPLATTQQRGWLRITPAGLPENGLAQLSEFLLTGEARGPVSKERPGVGAATTVVAEKDPLAKPPDLTAKPTGPRHLGVQPVELRPLSPVMRWTPVATAALSVGLGAVAFWQYGVGSDKYDQARAMRSAGPLSPADVVVHDGLVTDGDAARRNAWVSGAGAGVALVSTAVLSYFSYQQSHEIGPFRF